MYLARQTVSGKSLKKQRWKESTIVLVLFFLIVTFLAPMMYYLVYYKDATGADDCNMVTVIPSGHVIHYIREYMSLYALWKLHEKEFRQYHVKPYVADFMKDSLQEMFSRTSIPALGAKCENFQHDFVQRVDSFHDFHVSPYRNIRYCLDSSSYRYKDIIDYGVSNIRRDELQFRPDLLDKVDEVFESVRNSSKTENIVCMHFGKSDYSDLRKSFPTFKGEPNYTYYKNAMDYYKQKFDNDVAFILLTVEREWLRKNQAIIVSNGIVEVNPFKIRDLTLDFALLASCSHTIINYGSFGSTAALFSGGDVIVYDMFSDDKRLDQLTESIGVAKYLCSDKWLVGNDTHIGPYYDFH